MKGKKRDKKVRKYGKRTLIFPVILLMLGLIILTINTVPLTISEETYYLITNPLESLSSGLTGFVTSEAYEENENDIMRRNDGYMVG